MGTPRHTPTIGSGSDGLLTVNELARDLGISRWSAYRLVRSGDVRAVRVGERIRFRPADIDAYLERDA